MSSALLSSLLAAILFSTGSAAPLPKRPAHIHSDIDVLAPSAVFTYSGAFTAGGLAPGPAIVFSSTSTASPSTTTATTTATATTQITVVETIAAPTAYATIYATATQTLFSTIVSTATSTATTTAIASPTAAPSAWSLVANFDQAQLSSQLGVKTWEWGKSNVAVMQGVPASAWAPAATAAATAAKQEMAAAHVDLTNNTVMQVLFPSGSINPANKVAPIGGTGMYMTPLDLSTATNVTLEYSVFFEHGFDFVKGGKLPGLYGGHTGCSGGKESEDCFSTRIMFRGKGLGELYLYVPRDVQPAALCNTAPLSYCNSPYGLSIGRGAWTFATGAWTNIRQEIRLNTPGVADGGFRIFVNDKLVLESDAVLFRADLSSKSGASSKAPAKSTKAKSAAPAATNAATNNNNGGLLGAVGGLLGGLKERRHQRDFINVGSARVEAVSTQQLDADTESSSSSSFKRADWFTQPTLTLTATSTATATEDNTPTAITTVTQTATVVSPVTVSDAPARAAVAPSPAAKAASGSNARGDGGSGGLLGSLGLKAAPKAKLVTFSGAMFDTFFGGHTPDYASSQDQYIYFNRVGITINQ